MVVVTVEDMEVVLGKLFHVLAHCIVSAD